MSDAPKSAEEMVLYAWVGVDDAPPFSGEFGLKQAACPAGMIPMVACKEEKMSQAFIVEQMEFGAHATRKPRMLVKFKFDQVLQTIGGS